MPKTKRLTRSEILEAADILTEEIIVPDWGGSVFVRGLTGAQRDEFEMQVMEQRGRKQIWNRKDVRARLVVVSVVDEDGELLFSQSDIPAVSKKSARALEPIFDTARRLSGMSVADVKELSKNLKGGQNDGSGSA